MSYNNFVHWEFRRKRIEIYGNEFLEWYGKKLNEILDERSYPFVSYHDLTLPYMGDMNIWLDGYFDIKVLSEADTKEYISYTLFPRKHFMVPGISFHSAYGVIIVKE